MPDQEKCVEDWPEDSPQLNPDFRPVRRHFRINLQFSLNVLTCYLNISTVQFADLVLFAKVFKLK